MPNKQIEIVKDNMDKSSTYREMKSKYKKAMEEGFYFEALIIDYAMIEDRLRAFLYHIGALKARESTKLDVKDSNNFLLELYNDFYKENKKELSLKNISEKYKLIHAILNWVTTTESAEGIYQKKLKYVCESIDIEDVFECFALLNNWCKYRNEIIHGLMNKNIPDLGSQLSKKVEEGMKLAIQIDSYVHIVKKGHIIRKSINLETK